LVVYLEYAIIDNLVINSLLLWLTCRTVKLKPPQWRIIISAVVGTMIALALPLINVPGIWGGALMVAIRIFTGAMLAFIVYNKSFARYLLFLLIFVSYTFALGGAIYGVMFAVMGVEASLLTSTTVPVGVFIGVACVFLWILSKLVKFLNVRHSINNYLRDVIITYKDNKFKITSYLDTGNRLVDPKSQAPVVIITMSLFLKMFPDVSVDRILLNKLCKENIDDGHYINFSTIEKSDGKMFVFAPSKLEILDRKSKKTIDSVRLGVSMKGFRDAVKYDALLNAQLA